MVSAGRLRDRRRDLYSRLVVRTFLRAGAARDRARALEIMRDSRIGSFGAIALILVIGLKIAVIAGLAGAPRYAALYMAPGLGRWAMVAIAQGLDYLRI